MLPKISEIQSPDENHFSKDTILRLIIAQEIKPIFLRPHLDFNHKWALMIGWIGDRGGGKSAGTAVDAVVDQMISGKAVPSNMLIKCDINVDDDIARKYGLNTGGIVHYESEPLKKDALLNFTEEDRGKCFVVEEINVEYANVRRPMANTNVDFNETVQQARHFEISILYNVINEMFIDQQLRTMTDIFIKTHDTAFDLDSLEAKKERGLDFKWEVYPWSAYLCGEQGKYKNTHKSLPPMYLPFKPWRGIYSTLVTQKKGIYSLSTKDKNRQLLASITTESSPEMQEHFNKWGYLYPKIVEIYESGIQEMDLYELLDQLEINPIEEEEVKSYLFKEMRLRSKWSSGRRVVMFPERVFEAEREPAATH
jgi:hypothetical protein